MDETQKTIEKRKNKLKEICFGWVKDNYDKVFLGILIFAILIRLYYFFLTMNQPLWWDEAVYGSLATNFAYHLWTNTQAIIGETLIRPILFPFFWSILIRFGVNEVGVRFLLEFLPSVLSVFFVFFVSKELYNKRIALMSSFIFSVLWVHLFYTARLLTNVPGLVFLFSSMYFFIKSTKKEFIPKYFAISLFLLSLSTLIRYPNGLIFILYLFMLIIGKKFLINKKQFWGSGIIGLIPIIIFFIYNFLTYGNIFPAFFSGDYVSATRLSETYPIAYHLLNLIPVYLKTFFFIFFILGAGIVLLELFVGYNFISKNKKLRSHFFLSFLLIMFFSFFIFYLRGGEDRYFLPVSIVFCIFTSLGIDYVYKSIKKIKGDKLAILVIIVILIIGAYPHITFADQLIKNKQQSFLQMKQGFKWFAQNTPKETIVTGSGIEPYAIYYAQNQHLTLPANESESDKILEADYLVYHFFTPQASYIPDYLNNNPDKWVGEQVFFFDSQQQQPAFIIYKRKKI